MRVNVIRTEGLGDSSYILDHEGVGVVVDPQRDIDRFESVLDHHEIELRAVLETHLHNDYVSGGRDLARRRGAELIFPAGAAPAFRHTPAYHHETIDLGEVRIRPVHTPGHTPEHTSYVVLLEESPVSVFSGGSLLVGSAGRSDLLGVERADSLARLQFRSVNRLAELPDEVDLYPTHGQGSFCTVAVAGADSSTIGVEKRSNAALIHDNEDAFVKAHLGGLVPYPSYYRHMGPANTYGLDPFRLHTPEVLDRQRFSDLAQEPKVVDMRPAADFAEGHIPGSLSIGLRRDFGTWVGWVVPFNSPVVLVANPVQDLDDAMRQLGRIGFDNVVGVILDLGDWRDSLETTRLVDVATFAGAARSGEPVLDARAPNEWELGTIPDSLLAYAPDVVSGSMQEMGNSPEVWVACETGYRALIAASHLQARGFRPVVLANAGVPDVIRALGTERRKA